MKIDLENKIVICNGWEEVDQLEPVVGFTVCVPSANSRFTWHNMWNPIAKKFQIVRT